MDDVDNVDDVDGLDDFDDVDIVDNIYNVDDVDEVENVANFDNVDNIDHCAVIPLYFKTVGVFGGGSEHDNRKLSHPRQKFLAVSGIIAGGLVIFLEFLARVCYLSRMKLLSFLEPPPKNSRF